MSSPERPNAEPTSSGPGLYKLPTGQAGDWSRIWLNVGPAGMLAVLAAIVVIFLMTAFYFTLREMQKSQDHLFQRFEAEQKDNQLREDKFLERSDRHIKEQYDRWEKSRERSEEMKHELKNISTKLDAISTDTKALRSKEK